MAKIHKARKNPKTIALIMAAGTGTRLGDRTPKQYLTIDGVSVLRRSVLAFMENPLIDKVCVIIHPSHKKHYEKSVGDLKIAPPIIGNKKQRQLSVLNGLEGIKKYRPKNVLIHDAARPLVSQRIINEIIKKLKKELAAIPTMPVTDSLKKISRSSVKETIDRNSVAYVQTPQGFDYKTILRCHNNASQTTFTDDSALAEIEGIKVMTVRGEERNFKITTHDDLQRARAIMVNSTTTHVGMGIDAHAFGQVQGHGNHIMLCGIPVIYEYELLGHSDGDVGLHSIVDAILGAIGEADIGEHFSPKSRKWKNADSGIFVEHAMKLLRKKRGYIAHIDVTIVAEKPKVSPHRDAMRDRVAQLLNIPKKNVSVKATTTDKLGFLGRGEGIAAQAIATIQLENQE